MGWKHCSVGLVILALALVGCFRELPEERDKTKIFAFNNATEPETLDPARMTGQPEFRIASALFEGLAAPHPRTLEPEPGVAKSWDVSQSRLVYTFHLRDCRWSDGAPLTAEDFVYSWLRALDPETAADYAYLLYYVENAKAYNMGELKDPAAVGVRAVDRRTLEVRLNAPTPYFLSLCTMPLFMPVNRKCIATHGNHWTRPGKLVGNGPFKLVAHRLQLDLVMVKNPHYWDADRVKLETLHCISIDNSNTGLKMYHSGQSDWISNVPLPKQDILRERPDFYAAAFLSVYYYRFNVTKPPLDDHRVRKALAMAIDRKAICEQVLRAGQIPAHSFVPPGISRYRSQPYLEDDPEEAQRLLAEAGYLGGRGFPRLELLYNTSESHKAIAQVVQQMWKRDLGVNIELVNQEWKVYLSSVQQLNYDIARAGWIGDYVDPSTFLDLFVTGGGNNNTGWTNPRYDHLIAESSREGDPARRMDLFEECERLLIAEDTVIMPIYFYVNVNMLKPYVRGFYQNLLDMHPWKYVWIDRSGRGR